MTLETESGRIYRLRGAEDRPAAARIMVAHLMRWGTDGDNQLADINEAALCLVPKPSTGWN